MFGVKMPERGFLFMTQKYHILNDMGKAFVFFQKCRLGGDLVFGETKTAVAARLDRRMGGCGNLRERAPFDRGIRISNNEFEIVPEHPFRQPSLGESGRETRTGLCLF